MKPLFLRMATFFLIVSSSLSLQAESTQDKAKEYIQNSKMFFVENKGQIKDTKGNQRNDIKYYIKGNGMDIYFRDKGISYVLHNKIQKDNGSMSTQTQRIDLAFGNAGSKYEIVPQGENITKINILKGDLDLKNIRTFNKIVYKNVAKGIDLAYYPSGQAIKYDFIVRPDASLNDLKISYDGINSIEKLNDESFRINTDLGNIVEKIPITYQLIDNRKVSYQTDIELQNNSIQYSVENYNKDYNLVIDPVLHWSTFVGGSGEEIIGRYAQNMIFLLNSPNVINFSGGGIAEDDNENIYVTGSTNSTDFPWTVGSNNYTADWDIFLNKYDKDGSLQYSMFIGGDNDDFATDIACDGDNNPIIVGATSSSNIYISWGQVPYNPLQTHGEFDVYVFDYNGGGYLARCVNGTGNDYGRSIVVKRSTNDRFIVGTTESPDFEMTNCLDCVLSGTSDAIIVALDSNLNTDWTDYYGGNLNEVGMDIDQKYNEIAIVGATNSHAGLDLTNAYQTKLNNTTTSLATIDGFVARLFDYAPGIILSTYIGGKDDDYLSAVAYLDSSNTPTPLVIGAKKQRFMVAGFTKSDPSVDSLMYPMMPTTNYRIYNNGSGDNGDGFILSCVNNDLPDGHYIGGSGVDVITDLEAKVYNEGTNPDTVEQDIALVGYTKSADFHIINSEQQVLNKGFSTSYYDAFVVQCTGLEPEMVSSSYYGSDFDNFGSGVAINGGKSISAVGESKSNDGGLTVPNITLKNAEQGTYGGGYSDAMVWQYYGDTTRENSLLPTYFGGAENDYIKDIAEDANRNIYITGQTFSNSTTDVFPATTGVYDNTYNGNGDIFVSKFNNSGTHLYTTYIGGSGEDAGVSIALEDGFFASSSRIFVVGYTESSGLGTGTNAEYTTYFGNRDGFLLSLSNDGSTLIAFTYIGSADLGSGYGDEATSVVYKNSYVYVSGFMSMNNNSMLPTIPGCNSPYNLIDNKWNYNSIYCNEDNTPQSIRDGDIVGFVTKWNPDLSLIWGDWIRDQGPYYVKALDLSVMPIHNWIALVGITNGGDYIFPSTWTESYGGNIQNKNNYVNNDIDGWVMVIKDQDSTRFAEWGNLIEGKNTNYDADDIVNNVEWLANGYSENLVIAGYSNANDNNFDQLTSTIVNDIPFPYFGNNNIFLQKFDYIDTTFWGSSKVAFYGGDGDDQLYDIDYSSQYDSLALVGKIKNIAGTPTFIEPPKFDGINDNKSYYHGFVTMTDNNLAIGWGTFFGDGFIDVNQLPYSPQDFVATAVLIENSNNEVLFAGNTTMGVSIQTPNVFQSQNAGMTDGIIARLSQERSALGKQAIPIYTAEVKVANSVNLYPNPAKNYINISYERGVNVQSISLYNSTGKLEFQSFKKLDKIDISNLPVGIYHIQFDLLNSKQNCSFVKQ